jgi:hypothetical protein
MATHRISITTQEAEELAAVLQQSPATYNSLALQQLNIRIQKLCLSASMGIRGNHSGRKPQASLLDELPSIHNINQSRIDELLQKMLRQEATIEEQQEYMELNNIPLNTSNDME